MPLKSLRILTFSILLATNVGCSSNKAANPGSPLVGGTFNESEKITEPKTTEEERFIELQEKELEKQRKEIDDLKRQKFHDDYLRTRYPKESPEGSPSRDGFGGY
jgi:hypothetical protein